MSQKKIYTSGRMSGLGFAEQMGWREKAEKYIRDFMRFQGRELPIFIHPPLFYNYHDNLHKTEREVMDWELFQTCNSDIVIVNLEDVEKSIGTLMEIGAACGSNIYGGKHIHIVTFGEKKKIHPWLDLCPIRHEDSLYDAAKYIADYLLI